MSDLGTLAVRGGVAMAVRQVIGMVISFAGLIVLARTIGAEAYGLYASALGLHAYMVLLLQWGTEVFLIRRHESPGPEHAHQAFTLSVVLGLGGAAVALPVGLAAEAWIGAGGIAVAVAVLFAGLPLQLATQIPSALLQRAMDYRKVALAELAGQAALYGVAVGAAASGFKLAAPLAGWWAQQVVMAVLLFIFARYSPRLLWRRDLLRELVGYGLGYAGSMWIWHLRALVNPLIVARALGPEAAANVAVAVRLVEALAFMRMVIWRVSLAAMGRIQGDPARLAGAVVEGMRLQVLAIGPLMLGFSLAAPWLVPFAFGKDWGAVVELFPFLALAYLANAVFSLHSSALYVIGRNRDVALFHAIHVAALLGLAAILVPGMGVKGYGLAEVSAIATYAILHLLASRVLGKVAIGLGLAWSLGFAIPLFARDLGPAAWAGPALVFLLPATWRVLAGWWQRARGALADG